MDVSTGEWGGVGAAVAVLVVGLAMSPPAGLGVEAARTLAVFGFALVLWLTGAVPVILTSLAAVTLLFAAGAADSYGAAVSGFSSTLVFFFVLLLLLGHAISKVDLDEAFARRLLSATSTPRGSVWSLGRNLLGFALVMPSGMARTVAFLPVVERIAELYGLDGDSSFLRSSSLILGQLNPILSVAIMTGGGLPITAAEILRSSGVEVTWLDWVIYLLPPVVAVYVGGIVTVQFLYAVDDDTTLPAATDTDGAGSLTRDQRIVAGVIGGAILAWIAGSLVGVPTILPAAAAVLALALPGVRVITAADAGEISWGIVFLIGAMLSIIDRMEATGVLDWIVDAFAAAVPLGGLEPWSVAAVLLGFAAFARLLFPSATAFTVAVLPLLLAFAEGFGVPPTYLTLALVMVASAVVLLPFHIPTALYAADRGPIAPRDVFRLGLLIVAYTAAVIALAWALYWPAVVG